MKRLQRNRRKLKKSLQKIYDLIEEKRRAYCSETISIIESGDNLECFEVGETICPKEEGKECELLEYNKFDTPEMLSSTITRKRSIKRI